MRSCLGSPCCPTQRRRACRVDRAEAMDAASTGVGGGCPKLLETRSCCAACETKAKPRCARRGEGEIRPVSTVPRRIWNAWYFSRGTGDSSCLLVSYRPLAHAGLSFKAAEPKGRVAEKPHNNLLVRTPFASLQKDCHNEQVLGPCGPKPLPPLDSQAPCASARRSPRRRRASKARPRSADKAAAVEADS